LRIYAKITKSLHWISSEVCELPHFEGLCNVATFFVEFEDVFVEQQRLLDLDVSLREIPARWWDVHKNSIQEWSQCKRLMQIRFG